MITEPEAVAADPTSSALDAFTGAIARTKTGPLYRLGLGVVAFAMVLLPLIYLALIALAAWAVFLHLTQDTWILQHGSGRSSIFSLILYVGPAVVGAILVFFMVKPFFAPRAVPPAPMALDRKTEPLLFGFVQKICGLVGAPMPCRIDVDCQVNASASLRHGLWSKDLVLTIGLPLASGLEMRQFAGVLAHEFGHFAQGAGLRLTYIIRHINYWFARVVYERDSWDVSLEQNARNTDWRIAIVLHAARGCIWVTRRILWALMLAGNAISCFMLRQMEYDADSYEAKIAGSDVYESTASRMRVLGVAMQFAFEDVRQSWASSRLPENLLLLIDHKASALPAEVQQKLSTSSASEKTAWFDTHPCDADRIREARRLNQPGVFRLTEPTAGLFSNFTELSKAVTLHQYEKHFGLQFTAQNLMSAEEILRESSAMAEADAMVSKYYGTVNISLLPLLSTGGMPAISNVQEAVASWRLVRETTEKLRAEAEKISTECVEQQQRLTSLISANTLVKAGFRVEPKGYGLPESATSLVEQQDATRRAQEQASAAISDTLKRLEPFTAALRQRVTVAIQLAQETSGAFKLEHPDQLRELLALLATVGVEMPRVRDIGAKLEAFTLLMQNRANHSEPARVNEVASQVMAELRSLIDGIQEPLKQFIYPFPHARGRLTVAEYARSEEPAEHDWHRAYLDGGAHVERLFALHYRLVGRILAHADAAERVLEKR